MDYFEALTMIDLQEALIHIIRNLKTESLKKNNIKQNIMSTTIKGKTLGQKRVRADFNVLGDEYIDRLKRLASLFIDEVDQAASNPAWSDETLREWMRLKALAMTAVEEGAMWAVKAATI